MSLHFVWKEKWSDVYLFTDSQTVGMDWLNGQRHGKNLIPELVKKISVGVCG